MALKHFNPITPSQRQLVIVDRSSLYKGKPVKALTEGLSKSGGRNNLGRITARKGFVLGREIREGCVVPTVGGGICQLSNALATAATSSLVQQRLAGDGGQRATGGDDIGIQ